MSAGAHTVIAIDGPAASGKSTVARRLAARLGWGFVNTGAMYRAITWHVLRSGISTDDRAAVVGELDGLLFDCEIVDGESVLRINGEDPGEALTTDLISGQVSAIASVSEVRDFLVARQRGLIETGHLVMEGRDIGSMVFPLTPYKFYIDAAPEIRAQRRRRQGLTDEVARRDAIDSSRKASPLTKAPGASVIDSSHLEIEQVVDAIIDRARALGLEIPPSHP